MSRKKREGVTREESQIEAMREALRGDIERARSRNPDVFERASAAPVSQPVLEPDPAPSTNLLQGTAGPDETVVAPVAEVQHEVEHAPEPEPEHAAEPEPEVEPEPRPGFFRRLFGRR